MSNDPEDSGELAHSDDAIIGRAVRWSVAAIVFLAVLCAGAYLALKPKPAPPQARVTQLVSPTLAVAPTAEIPEARFTDITAACGITFTHVNGAYGEK